MSFLQQWLEKEFVKHPLFILFAIACFGIGTGALFNPFVMAQEFSTFQANAGARLQSLETSVCYLQFTTERNGLESQARAVSTEIFQLERLVSSGEATPRDVGRMDALKSDRERLGREMAALVNTEPCPHAQVRLSQRAAAD